MDKISNIPNKIKQSAQCCVHCGKGYKTRTNLEKHLVLCELLHKSKRTSLNDDEEEFTDKEHNKKYPNYRNFKVNQIKLMIYNESENRPNIINLICERVNNDELIEV